MNYMRTYYKNKNMQAYCKNKRIEDRNYELLG